MEVLLIALGAGVGFVVAYHTYGKWLGSKIFGLSAKAVCPSVKLEDGVDYVPTKKSVVFGKQISLQKLVITADKKSLLVV